jgi:hypothetical protein
MTFRIDRTRALIIVVAVAVVVHAPSLFNMFAYDDVAVIMRDQRVHSLTNLQAILTTSYWNDDSQALYRPLVTASFAADWALASNHPGWYHFVNILWNAAACALVFLLLCAFFPVAASLAGAVMFAVHPVHVEAVANVVGRAELMAATFGIGALLVWIRSRDRRDTLLFAPMLFALALFSKESAIMIAPLLVLVDFGTGRLEWPAFRSWLAGRRSGLLAIGLVAAAYLGIRSLIIDTLAPATLDAAIEVAPHGLPRLMTALQVWPVWLRLLIFPRTLLADYGPRIIMPAVAITPAVAAGFVILVTLLAGGVAALATKRRRTAVALLWIPIAALPVSNLLFPIGVIVAERTLYLPSFALSIATAALLVWFDARYRSRHVWTAVAIVALLFAARTVVRIPEWRNTDSIFDALMRDRPDAFRAHWHIARSEAAARRPAAALAAYGRTLEIWPYRARLLKEASTYAVVAGDLPFARRIAEHGMAVWPRDPAFPRTLGAIALDLGDTAQAGSNIRRGLMLAPGDSVLLRMQAELTRRNQQ